MELLKISGLHMQLCSKWIEKFFISEAVDQIVPCTADILSRPCTKEGEISQSRRIQSLF